MAYDTTRVFSIKGIDKALVLKALYDNSRVQGMGFLGVIHDEFTIENAREMLSRITYFDYLFGRVLKVDLSGDNLDPFLYDRDLGPGAAERAVMEAATAPDNS